MQYYDNKFKITRFKIGRLQDYKIESNYEYKDFYTDNEVRNFIKIPLLKKKDLNNNTSISLPIIKISRVIIGQNNPDPDATISQLLEIIKETKFSFEIWVQTTTEKLVKVI